MDESRSGTGRQPGDSRGTGRPSSHFLSGGGTSPAMTLLSDDTVDRALLELRQWRREDAAIRRDVTFASFMDAIRFVNRVADLAEAADHHPELTNVYTNVGIRLTTHDAGGITERDLLLAQHIEAVIDGVV